MKNYKKIIFALCSLSYCIVIGGAVYEHLAVIPQWTAAPPVSLSMFQGEYGLNPGPFWANVHPVSLLLFTVTLILFWKTQARVNILGSLITYFVILVITSIYFVPELMELTGTPFATAMDESLTERAKLWETLSIVRLFIIMGAAIYLFLGLTKSEAKTDDVTT
jgi:hypothetical protein